MIKTTGTFASSNGVNTVFYTVWTPEGNPRGIVQIVHGMCEYIDRYDEFAEFLAANGLIVCGNDNVGHGRSVNSDDELGFFAENDGDRVLVNDVLELRNIMRKKYRSLPYIILGHSMGSFITRALISAHNDAADAVILSGTSGTVKAIGAAKVLCKLLMAIKGKKHRSKFVTKLAFGGYNKRFEGNTGYEWVTNELDRLQKYAEDPHCTFIFTLSGYYDMFELLAYVNSDEWYKNMPKGLPLMFISGSEDPVGNYTVGVDEVVDKLQEEHWADIEVKYYKDERHEVLNGKLREKAFDDVLAWINGIIEGVIEARVQNYSQFGGMT